MLIRHYHGYVLLWTLYKINFINNSSHSRFVFVISPGLCGSRSFRRRSTVRASAVVPACAGGNRVCQCICLPVNDTRFSWVWVQYCAFYVTIYVKLRLKFVRFYRTSVRLSWFCRWEIDAAVLFFLSLYAPIIANNELLLLYFIVRHSRVASSEVPAKPFSSSLPPSPHPPLVSFHLPALLRRRVGLSVNFAPWFGVSIDFSHPLCGRHAIRHRHGFVSHCYNAPRLLFYLIPITHCIYFIY